MCLELKRRKKLISTLIFVFVCAFVTTPVKSEESQGTFQNVSVSPSSSNQLTRWFVKNSTPNGKPGATNLHGISVPSLTASQAIGTQGPILLQDYFLVEMIASFNRQRIPERVVHAKGAGAHGYFIVTHDITNYTKANFLSEIGKKTRIFTRFSTCIGEKGSADTVLDVKAFAIKFYTEHGNYDWTGINTEIFLTRDAMVLANIVSSRKKNPQTNVVDPNMWWDMVSRRPEATFHTLQLFSDIARPNGYRRMDGHAIHAYKFVNAKGNVTFAKMHLVSNQQAEPLSSAQSAILMGTNPDYSTQDLYDSIAKGDHPSWDFYIQVMSPEEAKAYPVNPFDTTKTWSREQFPWIPVGKLVLDRNPDNFFAEVEQAAFAPSNLVPGIEPGPDRVLAARLFAYQDAQRYRLGVNFPQLPINAPISTVNSYARDGAGCYGQNGGGSPIYYPNSFGGADIDEKAAHLPFPVEGVVDRFDAMAPDEYDEARQFVEKIDDAHRQRIIDDLANWMKTVREDIRERAFKTNFDPISPQFGAQMRKAVQVAIEKMSSSTSHDANGSSEGKSKAPCSCPMA